MDIDDILASVDVTASPARINDIQELTRCWISERGSPEILPWPAAVINRVLEKIHKQVGLAALCVEESCQPV